MIQNETLNFDAVARLPEPGDNTAIAVRRMEAGTQILLGERRLALDHTVMEGHRFAVHSIRRGDALLSWGLPYGYALEDISAGAYVVNSLVLKALRSREIDFPLPEAPNFEDRIQTYTLDEAGFEPVPAVQALEEPSAFMGYARPGGRGAGTRNHIVLLGLSSYTNGYVRQLEARLKGSTQGMEGLDGVVSVAHTEGAWQDDEHQTASNHEMTLRTLAGFVVNPNVGAVLLVERPEDEITFAALETWMAAHAYPLDAVPHETLSLSGDFEADLARGEQIVKGWIPETGAQPRVSLPVSALKVALQCGGSDAFSGISGNPLVGELARSVVAGGGSALLAETPELMGAEAYVLEKVRDLETAQRFLAVVERFKRYAQQFGIDVHDNVSGGNRFRGLYNITLKAVGAARKRHPAVRLDGVLDYGDRMGAPGYYFMDSTGNDLESIAGQVASGCNLVLFVTGNGSVTNFPFVPTVKVVTTTGRFNLMPDEMDVNAGRYLDGTPMQVLAEEAMGLMLGAASGGRTAGERAGHAQAQLWRAWPRLKMDVQTKEEIPASEVQQTQPLGAREVSQDLLRIAINAQKDETRSGEKGASGVRYAGEQVGLILPASLCSAQAARLAAEHMNRSGLGREAGIRRYAALVHTEGCGVSATNDELVLRVMAGYLRSPLVRSALVLEHGCERMLNDVLRVRFEALGIDPRSVGWASVQMDGGIRRATEKIEDWFRGRTAGMTPPARVTAGLEVVRLGLHARGRISARVSAVLVDMVSAIAAAGGVVVTTQAVAERLKGQGLSLQGALDFAEAPISGGVYAMQASTTHWTETLTGLGAAGVNVMLALVEEGGLPGHPLVPVLQAAEGDVSAVDLRLQGEPVRWAGQMLREIAAVLGGDAVPLAIQQGNVDFQITRGERGVSL